MGKIRKGSWRKLGLGLSGPVNPDRKVENENGHFYLWRISKSICGKNFSPIGQS